MGKQRRMVHAVRSTLISADIQPVPKLTRDAVRLEELLPSPSCPSLLDPQQNTAPSLRIAHVWAAPAARPVAVYPVYKKTSSNEDLTSSQSSLLLAKD
jgi:hypothetical protein